MSASTTELDQTITALQGGLTSIPPLTALSLVESFEQYAVNIDAKPLAENLAELKQLLTSGSATSSAIGQVLVSLGSQTKSVADGADVAASSKLIQLSELLTATGNSLF